MITSMTRRANSAKQREGGEREQELRVQVVRVRIDTVCESVDKGLL